MPFFFNEMQRLAHLANLNERHCAAIDQNQRRRSYLGLANLTYNLCRHNQLMRLGLLETA